MQHQTVPQSTEGEQVAAKQYRITFDRIGRNHHVAPIEAAAADVNEIAEAVRRVARKHLNSRFFDVSVDMEVGRGWIEAGRFGSFSIAETPKVTADKVERPVGDLFTVSGEHGRVSYDQFANRIELHDAYGDIEAMGKRWADQVAEAADRDDDAVFALLAEHYRTELAGGPR